MNRKDFFQKCGKLSLGILSIPFIPVSKANSIQEIQSTFAELNSNDTYVNIDPRGPTGVTGMCGSIGDPGPPGISGPTGIYGSTGKQY